MTSIATKRFIHEFPHYEFENEVCKINPFSIDNLIEKRRIARMNKDFALSDQIRDELANQGVFLEDGDEGTTWKRG